MRIGICTGGGDCPGLNAVIRAVVKHAIRTYNMEVIGICDSFNGLLERPLRTKQLGLKDVTEILSRGGTILGTHNKGNPYSGDQGVQRLKTTIEGAKLLNLDGIIAVGGEGTQGIARQLIDQGVSLIGIPKTIDNDLPGTDRTIGFDSCVDLVADSVMRLQSTAESHDRIMVLEVMGRDSGYIAMHGGLAGGANCILLPEIPFDLDIVLEKIHERKKLGRNFSVIVVSEGAREIGGQASYIKNTGGAKNLGGIGQFVAQRLHEKSQMDIRVTVLGHLQRGGRPSAVDKILGTRFGIHAVDLAAKKQFGKLVVLKGNHITSINYSEIDPTERRKIPLEDETLLACEAIGISLGRKSAYSVAGVKSASDVS